jgi:chorismate lyase / 3-hydroxybenzoate synthase
LPHCVILTLAAGVEPVAIKGVNLQQPFVSPAACPFEVSGASLAVRYVSMQSARQLASCPNAILGVVGYGSERPDFLPARCPFIVAPLLPAMGVAMFEIWTVTLPSQPCEVGPVIGACTGDIAFGAIKLDEASDASLQSQVESAYLKIFDFMDKSGFDKPVRFWNYLTSITADDDGLERYRRFNIGRHNAFSARLRQQLPPAASGVGGLHGCSVIYFLSARTLATPVENPRQMSAYEYPLVYGPRSPSFSRASIYSQDDMEALFISGTASIVGHETRHPGNLQGQIAETTENLHALIGAARHRSSLPMAGYWALKIYLQNPAFHGPVDAAITAMFGAGVERLYLHGDICRSDLLIEIEAFHCANKARLI